jgi:hypothetical protein
MLRIGICHYCNKTLVVDDKDPRPSFSRPVVKSDTEVYCNPHCQDLEASWQGGDKYACWILLGIVLVVAVSAAVHSVLAMF